MEFKDEMIGARLIESITSGLYDGNINCIREYVQNSIDSKAKEIEIFFENGKDLVIKDNGLGMDKNSLADALHIGKSYKSTDSVGWRGIGIWSGVPSSHRLVIITKPEGLDKKFRIEIDNDKLRNGYSINISAVELLTKATGVIEEIDYGFGKNESVDDHFTIIRLEGILPTQKQFFSHQEIKNYLSLVVPAPLNKDKFSFATKIDNWLSENKITFSSFVIYFEGEEILRGPTRNDIFFEALTLKEFRSEDDSLIAVGWFLATNTNKKEPWPDGGILFKKKGFTIGDENLIKRYYDKTFHQWFCGEIHILSDEIRENSARNNFEYDYGKVDYFFRSISDFINDLEQANRYISKLGQIKKVEKIASMVDEGKASDADLELKKLKKSLSEKRKFPPDPSLQSLKSVVDTKFKEKEKDLDKLGSKFDNTDNSGISKPGDSGISKPSDSRIGIPVDGGKAEKKSNELGESRDQLDLLIKNLPEPVRIRISRVKKGYETDIVITAADALEEILKEKTGLNTEKFVELTQKAFGWDKVTGNASLLTIDKKNAAKNRQFGVAVYIIYDLFVNKFKHERGTDNFEWFEKASKKDQIQIITEMYATISLLYRLISISEKP